jgi:hypothetical protein
VPQQRTTGHVMEHLGDTGLQTLALAGSEHHRGQGSGRPLRRHPDPSVVDEPFVPGQGAR